MAATGTYSDASTADISNAVIWSTSDNTIAGVGVSSGGALPNITIENAGRIWGGDIGVTATLAPGTPGTGTLIVIASDSGSVAPRMPQQSNHWQVLGLSPWGSWFGCQEATGTLIGSGSTVFSLTSSAGGGIGTQYQQVPPGWIRSGVAISGTVAQSFTAPIGTGPNPASTSIAVLGYGTLGSSNAGLPFLGVAGIPLAQRLCLSTQNVSDGSFSVQAYGVAKASTGPRNTNHSSRVHPFLFIYNRTTGEILGASDSVIAMSGGVANTAADGPKGFTGISSGQAVSASMVFIAMATGSIVEALCSSSASADFLTRLGWYVDWKDCPTESGSIKLPFLVDHWKSLGLRPWTATYNFQDERGNVNSYDRWDGFLVEGWRLATQVVTQYHYNIPDWTRGGIHFPRNNDARSVNTVVYGAAGTPANFDPTGSFAVLSYTHLASSIGTSVNLGCSAATAPTSCWGGYLASGVPVVYTAGATTTGSVAIGNDRVHPWLLVYDKTNSRVKLYTDMEKITGSFNALTIPTSQTASIGFGGIPFIRVAASGTRLYGALTTGSLAETLSDDGVASAFLKTLGWNISW